MKTFFEGIVNIPAGRKAGKYLQKIASVDDLSALVKSLPFPVVVLDNREEIVESLRQCHSCQSHNHAIDTYIDTWTHVPGVQVVAMMDNQEIMARCLVNPSMGTMAPCYGEKHYMLHARLDFAGFENGPIASRADVMTALEAAMQPNLNTFPSWFSDKKPPNPGRAIVDIIEFPTKRELEIMAMADRTTSLRFVTGIPYHSPCDPDLLAARRKLRRYNRLFKKVRPHTWYGDTFKNTHVIYDVSPWEPVVRTSNEIRTTLYIDDDREFLSLKTQTPDGYKLPFYQEYFEIDGVKLIYIPSVKSFFVNRFHAPWIDEITLSAEIADRFSLYLIFDAKRPGLRLVPVYDGENDRPGVYRVIDTLMEK